MFFFHFFLTYDYSLIELLNAELIMLLYREKLLSNGQLKRLSEHLYNCENIGLLDKYLQPFWNFLTSKTPLWLAPNVITVSGLIVNILTTLFLVWYSPDARAEVSFFFFL